MTELVHEWKPGGKLLGKQLQPRDIAQSLYAVGFRDALVLSDAVKVCLAESQGYTRAYNDNLNTQGVTTSRDVGLMQINIPASGIGTEQEEALYDPTTNFNAAFKLWFHRKFEPWVAYSSNVYLRDTYLKRANKGIANYFGAFDLSKTPTDTLAGTAYVHTLTTPIVDYQYRVTDTNNILLQLKKALDATKPAPESELKTLVAKGLAAIKS